eukprot:scaffold545_cov372-Pavlova_lutheri.AAC.30
MWLDRAHGGGIPTRTHQKRKQEARTSLSALVSWTGPEFLKKSSDWPTLSFIQGRGIGKP